MSTSAAGREFELQVADVFALLGYRVEHDTKRQGGQIDLLATHVDSTKAKLFIECKNHAARVGIDDADKFLARLTTLRNDGLVDKGYLISREGFTAEAKAKCAESNIGKAAQFIRFSELLSSLIPIDACLKGFLDTYKMRDHFVSLSIASFPYEWGTCFDVPVRQSFEFGKSVGIGVSPDDMKRLQAADVIERESDGMWRFRPSDSPARRRLSLASSRNPSNWPSSPDAFGRAIDTLISDLPNLTNNQFDLLDARALLVTMRMISLMGDRERECAKTESGDYNSAASIEPRAAYPIFYVWTQHLRALSLSLPRRLERELRLRFLHEMRSARRALETQADEWRLAASLHEWMPNQGAPVAVERRAAVASIRAWIDEPESNLFVLLGDYGAGKTTVIQRVMYEQSLAVLADGQFRRKPLLVNLRDYNRIGNIRHLIVASVRNEAGMRDLTWPVLEGLDKQGRIAILLDGFDEMLSRVTASERKRCFHELLNIVGPTSKVIVTGRPGYFPEYAELKDIISNAEVGDIYEPAKRPIVPTLACLQLMDDDQLDAFVRAFAPDEAHQVKDLLTNSMSLYELARRPVLAAMICGVRKRLAKRKRETITARDLYEEYTSEWIDRDDRKVVERVLMTPERKAQFMRYLAMQMHLSGKLGLHYSELNKRIAEYFDLNEAEQIDHFSHDIRTCSFLNRDDAGYYTFIHKSFMEYFTAAEFARLGDSPFCEEFNRPLTPEMIEFLDARTIENYGWSIVNALRRCLEFVNQFKDQSIINADYESAANCRDIQNAFDGILNSIRSQQYSRMRSYADLARTDWTAELDDIWKRLHKNYAHLKVERWLEEKDLENWNAILGTMRELMNVAGVATSKDEPETGETLKK